MSGKYKEVRKEVVSDFIKELIRWMGFLNQARKYSLADVTAKYLFFLRPTQRCLWNPYESLRTSSTAFRYLFFGWRDRLPSSSPLNWRSS
jgi:hypothetical protein